MPRLIICTDCTEPSIRGIIKCISTTYAEALWLGRQRFAKGETRVVGIRCQEDYGYDVLDMEVMPDHVHLLLDVDPKIGIYSVITKIKGYTSKQLREEFPALKKRIPTLWTHSKFVSSVGSVTLDVVKRYIEEQKHV
jgi:putative transposase